MLYSSNPKRFLILDYLKKIMMESYSAKKSVDIKNKQKCKMHSKNNNIAPYLLYYYEIIYEDNILAA